MERDNQIVEAGRASTVLVVDDDHEHTRALATVLERAGYGVCTASDGQEALARLAERSFELIITDLRMPRMNGLDLLRSARAMSPQAAVIVLTAYGEWETYVSAMDSGALDYLGKPARREQILCAVRKALARRGLRAANIPVRPAEDPASAPP
jgi:DNA-binding NtrC family response regulator